MTDELYDTLLKHMEDEIKDVGAYKKILSHATGYTEAVLHEIIKDEESHARYIRDAIVRAGRHVPEDKEKAYCEMEDAFHSGATNHESDEHKDKPTNP